MKKQLLSIGILGLMISGLATSFSAQGYINKKISDDKGRTHLITFKKDASLSRSNVSNIFKEVLDLAPNAELRLKNSQSDKSRKFVDEKYQLYHNNIPVEFGVYNLHFIDGKLSSMNGEFYKTDNANTNASLNSESALQKAIQFFGAKKYMWEEGYQDIDYNKRPDGELVLLPMEQANGALTLKLAYKFDIFAAEPFSRAYVYVDAQNGNILLTDAIIKHVSNTPNFQTGKKEENFRDTLLKNAIAKLSKGQASTPLLIAATADTRYSGTRTIDTSLNGDGKYILHDTSRGNGVRTYNIKKSTNIGSAVDFTDDDNYWSKEEFDNDNYDNAALDAHWGVSKTYDYFMEKHNRNSYNGAGALLRSYVHYNDSYENAAWSGSYMIYGDGATTFSPLVAFDVTAHELGHGVNSASAALIYQRESGALNEAFSDIWGATVENYAAPEKENWNIGEDITKVRPYHLRSMSDPKEVGQPDTYRGAFWQPATVEEGCITPGQTTNDYCGVHTNSGVLNHWYYILVEGKTGTNDIGSSYNVTGIGFEKAGKIAYRMLTSYLTNNSNYAQAREYGIQAAKDLYGSDSPEAIATQNAFHAVGIGNKYSPADSIAPTTPLNLQANSTTHYSTYLTWDASTDNFEVESYDVYKDGTLLANAKTNSLFVTGLSTSTTYTFKVQAKDVAGNKSDFSNEVSVTTEDSGHNYCEAQGNNTNSVAFRKIQINDLVNEVTSPNGYDDFSYQSTDVEKGKTYSLTITPMFGTLPQSSARYRLFIDYNNNGVINESNEIAWTQLASTATEVTGTFTIPANAVVGKTRMRITIANGTTPTGCTSPARGQVRDFSINILNELAVSDVDHQKLTIYPNPVKDYIRLSGKSVEESAYRIYSISGQVVNSGKVLNNNIDVNKLPNGNYILEVIDKSGEKHTQKFIKK